PMEDSTNLALKPSVLTALEKEPANGYSPTEADRPFRTGFNQMYQATASGDSWEPRMWSKSFFCHKTCDVWARYFRLVLSLRLLTNEADRWPRKRVVFGNGKASGNNTAGRHN